jgi:single-stranded-DNA-specific exonuclease
MQTNTLKKPNDNTHKLSAGGAVWHFVPSDKRIVPLLSSSFDIPLQVAHILNSRGIDLSTAEHFLSPKLKHEMPDPYCLTDMEKAVKIVGNAVLNKQKIGELSQDKFNDIKKAFKEYL